MTREPIQDDRAISVAVSHALSLAITAVLLSGLLVGAGSFVESNEQRVADTQLSEVGHSVATQVETLDRLGATGESVETTVDLDYPRAIVGTHSYTIALTEAGVVVESPALDRRLTVEIETDADLAASEASPPDVQLSLCERETGAVITLGGCD